MTSSSNPERARAEVMRAVSAAIERWRLGYGRAQALDRALGLGGYTLGALESLPREAVGLWSGCGAPLSATGGLEPGSAVLELGSGAGLDLLLAAQRVGPKGRVVGVEANEDAHRRALEIVERAQQAEVIELRRGLAEELPRELDGAFDLVFSNGLLSLSPERERVFGGARRALAPGGEILLCELVVVGELLPFLRGNRRLLVSGIDDTTSSSDYVGLLIEAGFEAVEVVGLVPLSSSQLEWIVERGSEDLEIAGCSASGAILGSEASALLADAVAVVTLRAQVPA